MKLTDRDSKWRTNCHGIAILDPTTGSRSINRERLEREKQNAFDANPGRTFYNLNIDNGAMWMRALIDDAVARESSLV